jgi:hypothetical protein
MSTEKQREANRIKGRKSYHKHLEKNRARSRAKYAKLTPEQKEARLARYRGRNREYRSERQYANVLKYRYGITAERYEELLQACNNKCPICRRPFRLSKKRPAVDHCHRTGITRGLLCNNCNSAEGYIGSVENARRLYEYMLKNELFYQGRS